jgi:hypothetical protein
MVQLREDLTGAVAEVKADLASFKVDVNRGFGALKESIEARDFRLDDHGRRLTELESSRP